MLIPTERAVQHEQAFNLSILTKGIYILPFLTSLQRKNTAIADEVGHETHCFLFWEGLLKNQADFKMTKQFFLASLVSGFVLLNLIMYFGCSAQAYVPNQFSPCSEWVSLFVQQLRKSFFHADFERPFSTHCKGIPGTTDLCSNWRSNSRFFFFFFFTLLFKLH